MMVNCLNGGSLMDELEHWQSIIVKRNGAPPVTAKPGDYVRGTFVVP